LTPSQLARKRANDREAQRAIRTRTKEHIDRLERELEEHRNRYSRDDMVQDLMRRNKILEDELAALRDSLGLRSGRSVPQTRKWSFAATHTYCRNLIADFSEAYENSLSPSGPGMSGRTSSSYGQNSAEYTAVNGFGTPYVPAPDPRESWASVLPCSVPSVVSSPASSLGTAEDYMAGYIPTSVPSSMVDRGVVPQSLPCLESVKAEYDDMESGK